MWLIGSLFAVAVVLFTISLWYVHMRMDDEYYHLRLEIDAVNSAHGARLSCLEMTSPSHRERLDALEKFLDVDIKAKKIGEEISGFPIYSTVYEKINRCKKCGGKT